MNNRIQLIAQAVNKIKTEQQRQAAKFAGVARQAVMLSDREYTHKKSVDTVKELAF